MRHALLLHLQAFDDCTTLSSTFKLLDSFEGLLEREAIAAELAKKQVSTLAARSNPGQLLPAWTRCLAAT